ncbi:YaaC family protein [Rhizobium sp. NRK18]|uniref:YaaC family protein n=1 Tax=Rhizobium sp. NRK18 TaxID=2964667 RepID=UPI0021C337ED|nr:hypothetical protein [Rhizobium sp. NRK18]MCQ2002859.1 hypothetical protein [Rhizobium sp. NRK18]
MEKTNPRVRILKGDIEQQVIKPMRSHGWTVSIVSEQNAHDVVELEATKEARTARFAFLYTTAIDNSYFRQIASRNERIFYHGQPYRLDSYARGVEVPIEPMGDFFPVLVELNKQLEPTGIFHALKPRRRRSRRITDENPQQSVLTRLEQFTSPFLCRKLVAERAEYAGYPLSDDILKSKAEGMAFSVSSALDYFRVRQDDPLNKRILGLYYGSLAFAFAEMLASPSGPHDLDEVEGITKLGHGLYTLGSTGIELPDLTVGVLASGFLPRWLDFLGYDTSAFPRQKAKNGDDLGKISGQMHLSLGGLLGSFPEIDDLYRSVIALEPSWLIPAYHLPDNKIVSLNSTGKKPNSTYCRFIDLSEKIGLDRLKRAGLPIAEVQLIPKDEREYAGQAYRARVDHEGYDVWWDVIPTHRSPSQHPTTTLLPTLGGMRDYRVLATVALYSLSIVVRYMPSLWRRVEGGDHDQYLALIKAALAAWERVLPQQFLESIADEYIHTAQPGNFF